MKNDHFVVVTLVGDIYDNVDSLAASLARSKTISLESEADPISIPLPSVTVQGHEIQACTIRYTGKGRRVTLARYLCGKIVFRPEQVERVDLLILYDNFLHIQDLAEKNENFKVKFGSDLESLAKILRGFRVSSRTNQVSVKKLGAQMKEKLLKFVLPERNLDTVQKHVHLMYKITKPRSLGIPKNQIPPKGYIGKGYTDKGTARDPAIDGTPSWQEVAAARIGDKQDEHE